MWTVQSVLAGVAAIVTASAGLYLAIRAARAKERKALQDDIDELSQQLAEERHARIECERHAHKLRLMLTWHGIDDDEVQR